MAYKIKNDKKKKLFILYFIFIVSFCFAQKPIGRFIEPVYYTGKPIKFSLSILHKNNLDLVFPDSTFDFSPFQLKKIEYFPTITAHKMSRDSAVYTLVCFEVDSILSLSLPIQYLTNNQKIYSNPAQIKIVEAIRVNDLINPKLKSNTGFLNIPLDINIPKIFYVLFIMAVSCLIVIWFFGNLITKQFHLLKLYYFHRGFMVEFKKKTKYPDKNKQEILAMWKLHMEKLLNKPFSSMTTTEITENLENDRLDEALKEIDGAIYGGSNSDYLGFAFKILLDISNKTYRKSMNILKAKKY